MLTHVYAADISKSYRDANGNLIVEGIATSPTLDLDQQICDPAWLKAAMPAWMKFGNLREMHQPIAAGTGLELVEDGANWQLKSEVVDTSTATKVERGVLKGYSIGIKGPKVVKDAGAPGGRIVGGSIVEVSLVDRPCNPDSIITIAKMAGDALEAVEADSEPEPASEKVIAAVTDFLAKTFGLSDAEAASLPQDTPSLLAELAKKDYTDAQRKQMADKGQALPGGGFPIANTSDLKNAIQAIGRAKDPARAKAHIKSRAKALGREDLIPDTWKLIGGDLDKANPDAWTHDPALLAQVRNSLAQLIQAELDELMSGEDEMSDVSTLLCSLREFLWWWSTEAANGEDPTPYPGADQEDSMSDIMISLGVNPDLIKAAGADDATEESKTALADAFKSTLGISTITEAMDSIKADLVQVKEMAAPGGPARTAPAAGAAKAAELDQTTIEISKLEGMISTVTDNDLRAGYREQLAAARLKLAGFTRAAN